MNPFLDATARRIVVLGHPGHELAVFGLLQRCPPDAIIVITDGGPRQRVEESQSGLASIGLLSRTRYLDFPERAFYQALLDGDAAFLRTVIQSLRDAFVLLKPEQVFCDAIEFYNPIHDITLPLVMAALHGSRATVYELPLVYEVSGAEDHYRVQRVPESRAPSRVTFTLSPEELAAKARARDGIYRSLHAQAGPELLAVTHEEMAHEEFSAADARIVAPGHDDRALRYERRARLLHAQGHISRMITYAGHFAPMLDALGVARD